jgi:hypothetical protein
MSVHVREETDGLEQGGTLDFGSLRLRVPAEARSEADEESRVVRLTTSAGRIELCVLAAPRSTPLWPKMSTEVAASQRAKGRRVHTEPGEWGDEVLSRAEGQLYRYIGKDGPRWMLFGLAIGPEETSVELSETLRDAIRATVVNRGVEPLPLQTALPIGTPGAARPLDQSAAGPVVFQLAPTSATAPNSATAPASTNGSTSTNGSAVRLPEPRSTPSRRSAAPAPAGNRGPVTPRSPGYPRRHAAPPPVVRRDNQSAAPPGGDTEEAPRKTLGRTGMLSMLAAGLVFLVGAAALVTARDAGHLGVTPAVALGARPHSVSTQPSITMPSAIPGGPDLGAGSAPSAPVVPAPDDASPSRATDPADAPSASVPSGGSSSLVAAVPRGARRSEGAPAIVHAPAATQPPSSRTGDDRAPSTGQASEDRPAVDRSENTAGHNADNTTSAAADHTAPAAGPLGGLSRTLTHVVNGLG